MRLHIIGLATLSFTSLTTNCHGTGINWFCERSNDNLCYVCFTLRCYHFTNRDRHRVGIVFYNSVSVLIISHPWAFLSNFTVINVHCKSINVASCRRLIDFNICAELRSEGNNVHEHCNSRAGTDVENEIEFGSGWHLLARATCHVGSRSLSFLDTIARRNIVMERDVMSFVDFCGDPGTFVLCKFETFYFLMG